MPARKFLKAHQKSMPDIQDDLNRYSPNFLESRSLSQYHQPTDFRENTMLSHINRVVEATQAAHEIVYRYRKVTPDDFLLDSRSQARAISPKSKRLWRLFRQVTEQGLHTDYLSYHPLLLALRDDSLRDENGQALSPELTSRLSRTERAERVNHKLADIRRRAGDKRRDLGSQINLFYRGARKNHRSVVDYLNQLLNHEPLLKVVSLQIGYYPRHRTAEEVKLDTMLGRLPPPMKGKLRLLRLLQRHRDRFLDPRTHLLAPYLFKGLIGYVWQQRWTPEQGFYLHWWLLFDATNKLSASQHGQHISRLWRQQLTGHEGVVFRQKCRHDRCSLRYETYGWVDALEKDRVSRQDVMDFQRELPASMQRVQLKQRTRLDHLQAMIDAQMGIEYYLQLNRPALLAQQGDARDQRYEEAMTGEKPLKTIRTLGKGQPPKAKPDREEAANRKGQASLPAPLDEWIEERGVPSRRQPARKRH